ncbi:MAG: phenylalanine--tRNA ligase subunit alpha, partial [Thermoleophilaceae bacterium]
MPDAPARLNAIRAEAEAAIADASSTPQLEELRVRYLGRKAELTTMLRSIGELPQEQRGPVGKGANEVKRALEALLEQRTRRLEASELDERLRGDAIDVTLPGDPPRPPGHLHLITETRREIEDVFLGLGFSVAEGPEIEFDYYNFTALNHPPDHPARMLQDTFYVVEDRCGARPIDDRAALLPQGDRCGARPIDDRAALLPQDEVLLRTHTSPMQVRAMEEQE